ncbi:copia protein [Tanacetum coccineum]
MVQPTPFPCVKRVNILTRYELGWDFLGLSIGQPDKNQRAFVGGSWSDSDEEDDVKANDETCLVAQALSEHVDNLGFNLLSVGKICDSKCKVIFSENDSEIVKDGKVIGRGIRKKGLYVMKLGTKPEDKIYLATIDENFTLWHRRLGHVDMRLIQALVFKELVRNLPKLKFDRHFYDACKMGKQAHASHKAKHIVSMTGCLEILHMDIFGPSAVRSYSGYLYTLVIVDDYSRRELAVSPSRNKARLVAQGYNQQEGIDYDETYTPISRLESIRIPFAYASALDFRTFQMDVKSAFLNGFIKRRIHGTDNFGTDIQKESQNKQMRDGMEKAKSNQSLKSIPSEENTT